MIKKINISKNAFTFIEIIVSITILVILSTLWFYSYSWHLADARDAERKSDLASVTSSLKLHKQKRAVYPNPWTSVNVLFSWSAIAAQWRLDDTVYMSTIDSIPKDPYINIPYFYSVTNNKQEFQLSATLENNSTYKAIIQWDYKSVSKNNLPTIVLAINSSTDIEIKDWIWSWSTNKDKFIFNNWIHNIPYTFVSPYDASNDWSNFLWVLNDPDKEFWQSIDYRSCQEIIDDWKFFWSWEYQIIWTSWNMININC